jgi:hypothetical protein
MGIPDVFITILTDALREIFLGKQDDYYRAFGKMAVIFPRIEMGTAHLLNRVLGRPKRGMTLNERLTMLREIVPSAITDAERQEQIKQVVDRIDEARLIRNDLIHCVWILVGEKVGRPYDPKKKRRHIMTLKELDKFNTTLEELLGDLLRIEKSMRSH